jgi:transcriptional regulator with XRE-family HTH domain
MSKHARNPLAAWREANGLTQPALAERLEVGRTHLAAWEAGRNLPQPAQADRIRALTGVTRADLAAWQDARRAAAIAHELAQAEAPALAREAAS